MFESAGASETVYNSIMKCDVDIRKDLYSRPEDLIPKLIQRFAAFPVQSPPHERVRACIIGVA